PDRPDRQEAPPAHPGLTPAGQPPRPGSVHVTGLCRRLSALLPVSPVCRRLCRCLPVSTSRTPASVGASVGVGVCRRLCPCRRLTAPLSVSAGVDVPEAGVCRPLSRLSAPPSEGRRRPRRRRIAAGWGRRGVGQNDHVKQANTPLTRLPD